MTTFSVLANMPVNIDIKRARKKAKRALREECICGIKHGNFVLIFKFGAVLILTMTTFLNTTMKN